MLKTGDKPEEVASRFNISQSTIYSWMSTFGIKTSQEKSMMYMEKDRRDLIRENAELKRRVKQLELELFEKSADALAHKTLLENISKKYQIDVKKKTDSK